MRQTSMARGLRKYGHKLTPQRLAVIAVVQEAQEFLTPQQVLERAGQICTGLGLTTVYRTLDMLSELGFVRRVHAEGDCHSYVATSRGHRHAVICQGCHRVVEFPGGENLEPLIGWVEAKTGYQISEHLLQLSGLCPDCRTGEV